MRRHRSIRSHPGTRSVSSGAGYFYISDDVRHADRVDERGYFTDAIPSRPKVELRQVVLISLSGESIDLIVLMTRGMKVATYWSSRG